MFVPSERSLIANRFRLRRMIGQGGMGEVWEAHDTELDGPCALKFILGHLSNDAGMRARFLREARAASRLRSPHATNILGVGEHAEAMYMAMELLEGETLADRLERVGRLDVDTTLHLIRQTVQVLDKAHAMGVVHRDLKPENLWLTPELPVFVKVLDFGIAKSTLETSSRHTATGALIGTPHYMSPEQAKGDRQVDHRSDLWALAIIALECLGGRRPFEGTGLGDLIVKIVATAPPSLRQLAPHLPEAVESWWQRALAREPDRRFQTGAELLEGLRTSLESPARGVGAEPAMAAESFAGAATARQGTGTPMQPMRIDQGSSMSPLESTPARAKFSPRGRQWWMGMGVLGLLGALGAAWLVYPRGDSGTEAVPLSQVPPPAEDVPKPVKEEAAPSRREQLEHAPAATAVPPSSPSAKAPLPTTGSRPVAPRAPASAASSAKPSSRGTGPPSPATGKRVPTVSGASSSSAVRLPSAAPAVPAAPEPDVPDRRLGF